LEDNDPVDGALTDAAPPIAVTLFFAAALPNAAAPAPVTSGIDTSAVVASVAVDAVDPIVATARCLACGQDVPPAVKKTIGVNLIQTVSTIQT
ncbi:hypothetical protein BGZ51_000612, partial [Haplosporangium sp. Z 767]